MDRLDKIYTLFATGAKQLIAFYFQRRKRFGIVFVASVIIIVELLSIFRPFLEMQAYALGSAESLLRPKNSSMAGKLKFDSDKQSFSFNNGQSLPMDGTTQTGAQQVTAEAYQDSSKGLKVTDPINKVDFTLTPKFNLLYGKQDGNRIVYPLENGSGWAVYTMQGTGVKEDILVKQAGGDTMTLEYELGLNNDLEARLEADGGIGVYGNTIFSGNISAATEKDAALLQKAKKNAKKDTLLFSLPKPTIVEQGKQPTAVKAS